MAVSSAGRIPNRASVMAMFMATPPGRREIRPATSDPCRIATGARPITSQRTEPMQRMLAEASVMGRLLTPTARARKPRGR
jgi:hypothetical protein